VSRPRLEALEAVRRDEHLPAADLCLQADNRWLAIAGVKPGYDVLDSSEPVAGRVEQRATDQRGKMEDRFGHPPEI
jgi:hypothetical protein